MRIGISIKPQIASIINFLLNYKVVLTICYFMVVAKHDAKKETKVGANLEAKLGTYLEVKRGAKWDVKVVAQMDSILDANLDANMALTGVSFKK